MLAEHTENSRRCRSLAQPGTLLFRKRKHPAGITAIKTLCGLLSLPEQQCIEQTGFRKSFKKFAYRAKPFGKKETLAVTVFFLVQFAVQLQFRLAYWRYIMHFHGFAPGFFSFAMTDFGSCDQSEGGALLP